jgi:hypothetical protein
MNMLHQFNGLISLTCDQYVQYLLTGPTHRSLTDIDEGLRHWRSWLTTSLSPSFLTDDPPLSPKGPTWSQVNKSNHSPSKPKSDQTLISLVGLLNSPSTIVYPLSIEVVNGKPPTGRVMKDN